MKIALFTETYVPDINGVAMHVKTLRLGLEAMGHEVLVICADKHCKHHYIQDGVLRCPSIEVKRFYGFGAAAPYSRRRLKLVREFGPDIIHIHHEFGIGLSGIMYAKLYKKPLVYTLHTMYDDYVAYVTGGAFLGAARKISHKYERFIARRATVLTGPSRKCGEYFRRIGVEKEVNVIPNSADLELFDYAKISNAQKAGLREKLNIPENRTAACWAGRMGKEKSVDTLLEYWAQCFCGDESFHLLLMGDGPCRAELEALAEKLGIRGNVTFTGMIANHDLPPYYAISDVFVSASLSEMNSISMLEGMACGLPVMQRYDELNADQILSGVNGCLFHTAEELESELRKLRRHTPEKLAELKQQVRASVVNRGCTDLAGYMFKVYEKAQSRN
ncbi:MAG: glycosyltransferase [Oscillospiraceae bacterium]|nr:glycosyltransferase [Oscillospiraceae bacterium]